MSDTTTPQFRVEQPGDEYELVPQFQPSRLEGAAATHYTQLRASHGDREGALIVPNHMTQHVERGATITVSRYHGLWDEWSGGPVEVGGETRVRANYGPSGVAGVEDDSEGTVEYIQPVAGVDPFDVPVAPGSPLSKMHSGGACDCGNAWWRLTTTDGEPTAECIECGRPPDDEPVEEWVAVGAYGSVKATGFDTEQAAFDWLEARDDFTGVAEPASEHDLEADWNE
ncbi:hypothetical protein [Halomarina oriensis]|uniref:Uncharacterized protein n=1 Tax=Halomarina oriensis TaxID=671145 RepID=A0A6B0GR48_9EURY|nr:hypothetical protein [Halomarina oriensis]MWG36551.1 hypothetical protein [Halomarina oriensis]